MSARWGRWAQFRALRSYYTEHVVNKVKASGALNILSAHDCGPDTIPLPATMIHDLSEVLGRDRLWRAHRSVQPVSLSQSRRSASSTRSALGGAGLVREDWPDARLVRTEDVRGHAGRSALPSPIA